MWKKSSKIGDPNRKILPQSEKSNHENPGDFKGANYWLTWSKTVDRWCRFWLPMLGLKTQRKTWWLGVVGSPPWWVLGSRNFRTSYITGLDMWSMYRAVHSVAFWTRVTSQDMCQVFAEAVHSVAFWTRVTSQVWTCVRYVPKQV